MKPKLADEVRGFIEWMGGECSFASLATEMASRRGTNEASVRRACDELARKGAVSWHLDDSYDELVCRVDKPPAQAPAPAAVAAAPSSLSDRDAWVLFAAAAIAACASPVAAERDANEMLDRLRNNVRRFKR